MDLLRTVFPLVVAGIFVFVLARMGLGSLRQRRWPHADGTVLQTDHNRNDMDASSFRVQVSFHDGDGRAVEAWAINPVGYETTRTAGTRVTVAYDPREPRRCYVDAPGQRSPFWAAVFAVGVLVFVLWVLFVVL
ncbi:DUF3592 domain-containing protein [Nocardioides donggukensis]|uniref:DUF3592 domain-containing protein n=1 Tax=Nocardioides donggukensis TaxID=2774019 RepID=A0A927Q2F1_9ACTN|nr:DUF3592 domain-containing protein [Nocardioides donggukensis]MBD8869611.1 DUF3592 domain-containing protein [Nocardioides donggukensis]